MLSFEQKWYAIAAIYSRHMDLPPLGDIETGFMHQAINQYCKIMYIHANIHMHVRHTYLLLESLCKIKLIKLVNSSITNDIFIGTDIPDECDECAVKRFHFIFIVASLDITITSRDG